MQNRAVSLMISIFVWLLVASLGGCATAQKVRQSEKSLDRVVVTSEKKFSITVDPRMELLAVVQHFTTWAPGGHIKSKTTYKEDIDNYFKPFRNHPAISCVETLINAGFTHDAPVAFILYHSDPPNLGQKTSYSDYLINRAHGEENLIELADALRDFARKTDFVQFYQTNKPLYDTHIVEVESLLKEKGYVQALEDFYGESRNSYSVILPPLFSGAYGITIETEDGYDICGVIGPCSLKGKRITFACLSYLESMMLHEWSHSFVNPLVDKNYDIFKKSIELFEPIKGMMRNQAYPNWRVALYEHVVRACEIHLRANLYEDFRKEEPLSVQEGKGFWYISYIDSLLDVYETDRKKFSTFSQFVPVIANKLLQISIDDLPERLTAFRGPLSAIFPRTDSIYLIYPTAIEEGLVNKIKQDLTSFAGFLYSAQIEPILISDKEALDINWQDKVGFIYGNTRDNVFFRQLEIGIPVEFHDNTLEFHGKRYEGEGILLISCIQNPFNKKLPFVLCVANMPEDLIGIGSKIGSPSEWNADYVVYRADEKLESGCYHKEKSEWSLVPEEKQD